MKQTTVHKIRQLAGVLENKVGLMSVRSNVLTRFTSERRDQFREQWAMGGSFTSVLDTLKNVSPTAALLLFVIIDPSSDTITFVGCRSPVFGSGQFLLVLPKGQRDWLVRKMEIADLPPQEVSGRRWVDRCNERLMHCK